jgi:hypothetical protein
VTFPPVFSEAAQTRRSKNSLPESLEDRLGTGKAPAADVDAGEQGFDLGDDAVLLSKRWHCYRKAGNLLGTERIQPSGRHGRVGSPRGTVRRVPVIVDK